MARPNRVGRSPVLPCRLVGNNDEPHSEGHGGSGTRDRPGASRRPDRGTHGGIGLLCDEAALDTAGARGALLPVRAVIGGGLGHLLPGDRF